MDIQWGEVVTTAISAGTLLYVALRFPSDRNSLKSRATVDTAQTFKVYTETVQDLNDRLLKRNTEVNDLTNKYNQLDARFIRQGHKHRRMFRLERAARLKAEGERDALLAKVNTLQATVNELQTQVNNLQNPPPAQVALPPEQS